jgi:hypothetical protein
MIHVFAEAGGDEEIDLDFELGVPRLCWKKASRTSSQSVFISLPKEWLTEAQCHDKAVQVAKQLAHSIASCRTELGKPPSALMDDRRWA